MKKHKHFGNRFIIKPWGKYYLCDYEGCNQEFESLKRKLINWFIWKWRFYCGRGETFISDINGLINTMGGVGVAFLLLDKWFDKLPGGEYLIGVWIFQKALVFFLGYMDYHHWHLFQTETTYSIQFSPMSVEILTRLRNIERVICEGLKPSVSDKDMFPPSLPYKKESVLDNIQK